MSTHNTFSSSVMLLFQMADTSGVSDDQPHGNYKAPANTDGKYYKVFISTFLAHLSRTSSVKVSFCVHILSVVCASVHPYICL